MRKYIISILISLLSVTTLFSQKGNFPFYQYATKYNVGEIMPKDQGGKFVQEELLQTESDAIIVEKIRGGLLQKEYGDPLGWEKFEKTEIERSVWINRFYYLPSFARMYYLTKDKTYLSDMMGILESWIADNPRDHNSMKRTYNWRDMQVAWRSINLSWCYYLGREGLSSSQKKTIIELQREHADVLMKWFAPQPLHLFNHQSHGGIAMLYLATLFPTLDKKGELKENAMRLLTHHLNHAMYEDGGNVEQMFGYHPFQTSIFRDMYLLCKSNKIPFPDNLHSGLEKMLFFMTSFAQPDATMPPVNDSYAMDIIPSVSILKDVLGINKKVEGKSGLFKESKLAVIRGDKWYILLNPAERIGSHSHAGRLGLLLWYDECPVLIESGCPNYDNRLKNKWYRTSMAHNTVLIDGVQDAESSSDIEYARTRITNNNITTWREEQNYTYCKMTSPKSDPTNLNVEWERRVALIENEYTVIYDRFISNEPHKYETLFHTPSVDIFLDKSNKTISLYRDSIVTLFSKSFGTEDDIEIFDGYLYSRGKDYKAPVINYISLSKGEQNNVYLVIPKEKRREVKNIEYKLTSDKLELIIFNKDNSQESLIFRFETSEREFELLKN